MEFKVPDWIEELHVKYRHLFSTWEGDVTENSYYVKGQILRGIEVAEAWKWVVEKFPESLEWHRRNRLNVPNPDFKNESKDGKWVVPPCLEITLEENVVKIFQIKEKFGQLRIYIDKCLPHMNSDMDKMIAQAEARQTNSVNSCGKGCKLCRTIERENWRKTKRIIRRDSKDFSEYNLGKNTNGDWQKAHRNIAFLGDNPDAILASLPSYLSREIIFQNKNGIHYFFLTWQIGKVSRVGSRINSVFYLIGLRNVRIRASRLRYSKLKWLREY